MEEQLFIRTELAQAVLDYLKFRPYQEVAALIAELVKLEPAPKIEEVKAAKKEDR